jgi:hypothetical protein
MANTMRKSQVSIQFSWIFILIAGALILVFFINVVQRWGAISEQRLSATVLNNLETIITGTSLSQGTVNPNIETPTLEINFACDEEGLTYSTKGITKKASSSIAFAPEIKGKKMIAWALGWSAPFKVVNFLYLSDPDTMYVFVDPISDFAQEIFSDFPSEFSKKSVSDLASVSPTGFHSIKLIYFNSNPGNVPRDLRSKEIDVSAVKISDRNAEFYSRNGTSFDTEGSVLFITGDMPSAYGAIFSKDKAYYECAMKLAYKRLNLIAQIYETKQENLSSSVSDNPTCKGLYTAPLSELASDSLTCSNNLDGCVSLIESDIEGIKSAQLSLIRKSCPWLY